MLFGLFTNEIGRISKQLKKLGIPNKIVKYPVNHHPFKPFGSSTCEIYTVEDFWVEAKKADFVYLRSVGRNNDETYIHAGLCYKGD